MKVIIIGASRTLANAILSTGFDLRILFMNVLKELFS